MSAIWIEYSMNTFNDRNLKMELTQNYVNQLIRQAHRGDAQAQCHIGLYYFFGRGVEKDKQEALRWFVQAAQQQILFAHYIIKGLSLKRMES